MKKILKIIIPIIMFGISIYCFKTVYDMNMIPDKYLYILLGALALLNILGLIFILIKGVVSKVFSSIIYIILLAISIIGIKYGYNTIKYLDKGFSNNVVEVNKYDVIVLKNSSYSNIEDLSGKNMGYLSINMDDSNYLDKLNEVVTVNLVKCDIYELYSKLTKKSIDAIVINESYLDMLEEEYKNFENDIKIIYSFEIEKKVDKDKNEITSLKPFSIYVSGSDSRSDTIVANSRSDVNMIITINPETNTILLTSIPRDYYVQLHGTTGLKDKLTHAGIYGVDMSRETLEDLFDTKIDYSIKVSMPSVVALVDEVGGVDIYSDTTFKSYHINGWVVKEGMNHMNGKEALAYARERYAYSNGDVHRVQNQQQVLEAVFEKITSDKSMLLKYDKLLDSFSNLYRTDIPSELITLLGKDQLSDMKSWNIEKQYVTGSDYYSETYSMPGVQLYVMVPNVDSVNSAKEKINTVLGNEVSETNEEENN